MYEIIMNAHMHTRYSDGNGSHRDIAQAAIQAGLDAVFITDHNVLVKGMERYHTSEGKKVLVLVGEEVHDQDLNPQKNHMLILGGKHDLSIYADSPQGLIDQANAGRALTFLAHPCDPAAPKFHQEDLSWVRWDINGYTGIELWNGLTELKPFLTSRLRAMYYVFNPAEIPHGPFLDALRKWDELLSKGKRVVAIGGSDAHAIPSSLGPFKRTIFPYEFHFRCINNHLLLPSPLNGDAEKDKERVIEALRAGHSFIGYDLPAPTKGFHFNAQGKDNKAIMGDEILLGDGVTFQIKLPLRTECRLIKDGQVIKTWTNRDTCTHITPEPGVYRVEVFIHFRRKLRGWIYSNPIYVREKIST